MRLDTLTGVMAMYDGVATLKAYGPPTFDEAGNEIPSITETKVYVQSRSVYASERYEAARIGLKPSIVFDIANRADYSDEEVIEYDGKDYTIIRVDWNAQRDKISLVCEERVGQNVPDPEEESDSDGS